MKDEEERRYLCKRCARDYVTAGYQVERVYNSAWAWEKDKSKQEYIDECDYCSQWGAFEYHVFKGALNEGLAYKSR